MATESADGVGAGGGLESEGASGVGQPLDVEHLKSFLLRIVPPLLEEDVLPDISVLEKKLAESEGKLKKFISDPQERLVFIYRTLPPETEEEGEASGTEAPSFSTTYEILLGFGYKNVRLAGLALVKKGATLEAEKTVRSQLRIMNISEDSPFETLHSYIKDAMTPFFHAVTSKKTG